MIGKIKMFFKALRSTFHYQTIIWKGQKRSSIIIQTTHRLEKGLCQKIPKAHWGREKAEVLVKLIDDEMKSTMPDYFAIKCAIAVLVAYKNHKLNSGNEIDIENANKLTIPHLELYDERFGGCILASMDCSSKSNFLDVINGRHSIRNFKDECVDLEKIKSAINLANKCPSACNRQPYKVYIVDAKKKVDAKLSRNDYNADKFLIITGLVNAFSESEINDWLISATFFAAYLTLTLQFYNIGCCVMRKDLACEAGYNKAIRAICGIPQNEQIVIEMAIGYPEMQNFVPVSKRKEIDELIEVIL